MTAATIGAVPATALAGGGLAAAALLVAAAMLARRRRGGTRIDDEAAAMAAADTLPGFRARAAVVAQDGAAALVSGSDAAGGDRLALVHVDGRRVAVRPVDWPAVRAAAGGIVVEAGRRGGVAVTGVDALDVRRLAPAASPGAQAAAERLSPPAMPAQVNGR